MADMLGEQSHLLCSSQHEQYTLTGEPSASIGNASSVWPHEGVAALDLQPARLHSPCSYGRRYESIRRIRTSTRLQPMTARWKHQLKSGGHQRQSSEA